MNNKITMISCVIIALFSFTFFIFDGKYVVEKPIMNDKFQPFLVSNEFAFKQSQSQSSAQTSIERFSKPIPASLQGIDLNIELPLDADGNLIVGLEIKDLFEIYLSAMGEEKLDDILLRIQHALAQQLSSPALEQGYDALKRFVDYKVELANLEQQALAPALNELVRIRRQKEILAAIQQEYFSPIEADVLFAAETQYDDFMLEHLTIQQNENLTLEEKQQQVQALEASLPEDIRTARENVMAPAKIYQQAQFMKEQGYTAADIYTLRAESLGEEAATALAQLDQEREQWQQRLNTFSTEYDAISASGLSQADQDIEVSALLGRDFTAIESIRVRALTGL